MTLPFVSAGGSSLLASWLMVGLVVGIGLRRTRAVTRESRIFGAGDDEQG